MKDLLGKALLDYYYRRNKGNPITETSISEADELPLSHFFRTYNAMPDIEKKALDLAQGKVLDVGAGAGSHSLYLQNYKKLEVTAIDISEGACEVCKLRGLHKIEKKDLFTSISGKFDTILLLMNGTGICGTFKKLPLFLNKLKSLLAVNGQILIDSSDIIYMFDEDEDGGRWITGEKSYYGELMFTLFYNNEEEKPFPWLYLDFDTLKNACIAHGLQCELVLTGEHYDYLARISDKS